MPPVSRPRPDLRRHRALHGPGRLAHHPRARHRLVAAGVARPEPARHPRHHGLRRGPPLARPAEEGPRLDPLHRGVAQRPGLSRLHPRGDPPRAQAQGRAELHGDVHRRQEVRAGDVREDRERVHEEARLPLHGEQRVSRVRRQAAPARVAHGEVRGLDIADMSRQPLKRLAEIFRPWAEGTAKGWKKLEAEHPEKAMVALPDRQGPRGPARGAARPRPRLHLPRAQHAHPLPRRAPAPPARHPGAQQPVRRGVRAGRAVRRAAPEGHREPAPRRSTG